MKTITQLAVGSSVTPIEGKGNNLTSDVTDILTNIIAVLGVACVVVMIIGGVNYMTSSGDASKVEKGKKTILYGLIGLIVCALAFVIVNFVIGSILKQGTTTTDDDSSTSSIIIEQKIM
ncbi:MAG: pilin [Candidatus Saccharibacteria bacterium]|nr:pilin [Candidatus Saccharibacteria bacterium]